MLQSARIVIHPLVFGLLIMSNGCQKSAFNTQSVPAKQPAPDPVKLVSLSQQQVSITTRQPANVKAFQEAHIASRIEGYVKTIHHDIGAVVQAGDILAEIDLPEQRSYQAVLEARLDKAEADVQGALSRIEIAQARVSSSEAMVRQARSALEGSQASVTASQAEFQRTQDLVSRQSLEPRMLDEVRKRFEADQAAYSSSESAVVSSQANVEVAQAELRSSQAEHAAMMAEKEILSRQITELQTKINFGLIKAPFDGIVTSRNIDQGDLVDAGHTTTPMFVVSQVDQLRIQIPVPENLASTVQVGDEVDLTFSGNEDVVINATISRTSSKLDESTRTMLVEADYENAEHKLLPGMFGQALITGKKSSSVTVLPSRAVRFSDKGAPYLFIVSDDDKVVKQTISIGKDLGEQLEILDQFESGVKIVDSTTTPLLEGQVVTVLPQPVP